MARWWLVLLAIIAPTPEGQGLAQSPESVVGAWRLVSATAFGAGQSKVDNPYGVSPAGRLVYTAEGHMAVVISHDGRKPLSGDRTSSPTQERAEAFATFLAYAGRYSLRGSEVVHHVEVASVENWAKTDLIRAVRLTPDRITLTTPPLPLGGQTQTFELVWERLR